MVAQAPPITRSREDLQLLAVREILRATASALPLDQVLAVIANMTIIVFDARTSWFMLAEDTDELHTVVVRGGLADALTGTGCADQASSICTTAQGTGPLVLRPGQIDPNDPVVGAFASGDEPIALVPLKAGDRTLGLLGAAVSPWPSLDISFLLTLAEQGAAAIECAKLREETRTWRERLDAVFERMAEPVLVFDGERKLALMNDAAAELLADKGVRIGDSLADLSTKAGLLNASGRPVRPDETSAARALRGEPVENLEVDLPMPGAPTRHLMASATPITLGSTIQGAVVVWRDVTYFREMERMRAEFLSMVSHELRTPLTSVLGYTQLLERQLARGIPPKNLEARLSTIAEQTRRVNGLVEDLLDSSRAEAGRMALKLRRMDLAEVMRGAVDAARASAPGHRFRIEIPADVPAVRADSERIEQVLGNLLSNAVKFSPPGTEVAAALRVEPERLVFSVSDQGRGIAKEDLNTLFMPFHRVRQAEGREIKGVGLGLFISRSIVEAHGGEMWVHSELGKGSTFYFSIPRGN